jgi:hypothetical protein
MISLRRILRGPDQSVRSLAVQANDPILPRDTSVFETLTRHLLDRLVNNEALGEEIPTRVTQIAYAISLPGVLVSLYLFAAYHQPHAIGPRPFWLQMADHFFYTTYALVVMGAVTVFEWDLLFPDLLDVLVLSTLPIPKPRLLFARLLALAIFLALVLIGTNSLGAFFFPAVADLHRMFWHHLGAHILAVAFAGAFAAAFFVALQGALLCIFGRRLFAWISPLTQALSIILLLTILFLFPLLATHLQQLLNSGNLAVRLFPPFWFLGLYERLLWGSKALPVFTQLAKTGLLATAIAISIAIFTYPLAYARRTRQLIEGAPTTHTRNSLAQACSRALHLALLRSPQQRAIYHFISQTIFRTQRLHLYLSIYAGLGLSLTISGMLLLRIHQGHITLAISDDGIRAAIPILVFWITIGLRTALNAPIGRQGSWVFHVIHGEPLREQLDAAHLWVITCATVSALACVFLLHPLASADLQTISAVITQTLLAIGLSILLTDIFFLRARSIPFTTTRTPKTTDLPISFVRYFVIFPAFALYLADREPWIQANPIHILITVALLIALHFALRAISTRYLNKQDPNPVPADAVLPHRLGLQEY